MEVALDFDFATVPRVTGVVSAATLLLIGVEVDARDKVGAAALERPLPLACAQVVREAGTSRNSGSSSDPVTYSSESTSTQGLDLTLRFMAGAKAEAEALRVGIFPRKWLRDELDLVTGLGAARSTSDVSGWP